MITREAIVAEAISWVGTPYQDVQGLKGPHGGVDCGYLVYVIGQTLGGLAPDFPRPVYSPQWHLHQKRELYLEHLAQAGCRLVPTEARQPGDLALFRFGHVANHVAIFVTLDDIVHAHTRRVLLQPIPSGWWARLVGVYTFPGVHA